MCVSRELALHINHFVRSKCVTESLRDRGAYVSATFERTECEARGVDTDWPVSAVAANDASAKREAWSLIGGAL